MNALSMIADVGGPGSWGSGWFGGGGGPYWLLFPLIWIVVIGTVVWLVSRRSRRAETPAERATAILTGRYARGEIDVDEYHQRLEGIRDLP